MIPDSRAQFAMMVMLGVIAVVAIIAGTALAVSGYSSAGAYAVASACVGVLGTLVATRHPPPAPPHDWSDDEARRDS